MSKHTRARKAIVDQKLEQMAQWYLGHTGMLPQQLCVDKKAYKGLVLRWFEPPVPGVANPLLIEEYIGDSWSLRIAPLP